MARGCALLLGLLAASSLHAAPVVRYTFSSPNYGTTSTVASCATPGLCADFTTSMAPGGDFTTSPALPANLSGATIDGLITSFSVSNGIDFVSSSDPNVVLEQAQVWTDAAGAITQSAFSVYRWLSGTPPHSAGDRVSLVFLGSGGNASRGVHNTTCGAVDGLGRCTTFADDSSTSSAIVTISGSAWTAATVARPATSVPSSSAASLVALALALGALAASRLSLRRRQDNRAIAQTARRRLTR